MMKNLNRKFALPYNGEKPDLFLKRMEDYRENIDSVYMGLPEVRSHLTGFVNTRRGQDYDDMCAGFLKESENSGFTRFVTINSCYDRMGDKELLELSEDIKYQVLKYDIDGVVCADYFLAMELRAAFPGLLIDTSCNNSHHEISKILTWQRDIGIHAFNPPRPAVRNIEMLKRFKKAGVRTKVLINEGCVIGCPYEINHFVATALNPLAKRYSCIRGDLRNHFRRCVAMPRWLDILDEYIDIYKLAGRYYDTDRIFRQLEIYLNGEECDYFELFAFPMDEPTFKGIPIKSEDIPDRLLYCNSEDCLSGCRTCDGLVEKFFDID